MKSLLRLSLMLSLIVVGKLNRTSSVVAAAQAPETREQWRLPVQNASFGGNPEGKRKIQGGSLFWRATAPTSVATENIK